MKTGGTKAFSPVQRCQQGIESMDFPAFAGRYSEALPVLVPQRF
jgi:hypothetical protein